MARLRRVDCSDPGIERRRRGRGFEYFDAGGDKLRDPEVLERIRGLAIPPAWEEVWICPHPNGHLQAVGTDDAGRRQYLYHDRWREQRDREKFDRMLDFARALPDLRRAVERDLALDGAPRPRVLACAGRLLDLGLFRIGGEEYAEENGSFGLATIRKEHVRVGGDHAEFDYEAKGGARRVLAISDPEVLPILRTLRRRRNGGPELLAYREGRAWVDVRSADINDYIRERAGGPFTAKDHRTWGATLLFAAALAEHEEIASSRTGRERQVRAAIETTADYLGNTPTVCRDSYLDPRVTDRFHGGETIRPELRTASVDLSDPATLRGRVERATIGLIERAGARAAA